MALIVQKYGGDALGEKGKGKAADETDLSGPSLVVEKFRRVAEIVKRTRDAGHQTVVVVSAMGDTTNRLLRMANALATNPPARELDALMATGEQQATALLAVALHQIGVPAASFTGPQVGIQTDSLFGKSRIRAIHSDRVLRALRQGCVPIVAGFQGHDESGDITTLGRGGSDITAVALAAAIKADECEFYKDVDGIYTTDPRVCKSARKIDRISYEEMLELASLGAGVLHSRSVEFASNYNVPLHVRSFLHDKEGTRVVPEEPQMEDVVVSGVAFNKDEARLTLKGLPDSPGTAARVFSALGQANIIVDMIIQANATGGRNDISFTVTKKDFAQAQQVCQPLLAELGGTGLAADHDIAKVSAVGVGMRSHSNVAATMFQALAEAGVNIEMITTSEVKVSVLVKAGEMERAVKAIHDAFVQEENVVLRQG